MVEKAGSGCNTLKDLAKSGKPKTTDSKAVLKI